MTSGPTAPPESGRRWERGLVTVLLGLAALAWFLTASAAADSGMRTGLLTGGGLSMRSPGMAPSLGMGALFLTTWFVMMAAMMLPALAPVAVIFDRWRRRNGRSRAITAAFVAGYLLVWGASGLVVYGGAVYLGPHLPSGEAAVRLGAGLLAVAGLYQLTPWKRACLRHCRSPLAFLAHHTTRLRRRGPAAFRVGAGHGLYCLGCCWGLMLVLIALGMMSLAWMAAVAAVILLEKVLPRRWPVGRAAGAVLLGVAAVLLVAPRFLPALP